MVGRQTAHAVKTQCPLSSAPGSVHQVQQNTSLALHTDTNKTKITMGGSQHSHTASSQRPSIPHREEPPPKIHTVSVGTQTCQEHQTDYGISQLPSNLMQISADSGHKSSMELLISKMKCVSFQDQVRYSYWILCHAICFALEYCYPESMVNFGMLYAFMAGFMCL